MVGRAVRVLFLCSRNRLRSPTAEQVFSSWPGVEAESAGLSRDAVTPLSSELVEWAELIFVMENAHRAKLSKEFRPYLKQQKIICLGIPDCFTLMQRELVDLLVAKVGPHLRR